MIEALLIAFVLLLIFVVALCAVKIRNLRADFVMMTSVMSQVAMVQLDHARGMENIGRFLTRLETLTRTLRPTEPPTTKVN